MKKLLTLAVVMVAFAATSFAQYGDHRSDPRNDYALRNNRDNRINDSYYFTIQERDMQIARINREFDFKIASIRNDRYLRRHQEKVAIRNAEAERDQQIRMIYAKFNNRKNRNYGGYNVR